MARRAAGQARRRAFGAQPADRARHDAAAPGQGRPHALARRPGGSASRAPSSAVTSAACPRSSASSGSAPGSSASATPAPSGRTRKRPTTRRWPKGSWRSCRASRSMDVCEEHGVDPTKVVVDHNNAETVKETLNRGSKNWARAGPWKNWRSRCGFRTRETIDEFFACRSNLLFDFRNLAIGACHDLFTRALPTKSLISMHSHKFAGKIVTRVGPIPMSHFYGSLVFVH